MRLSAVLGPLLLSTVTAAQPRAPEATRTLVCSRGSDCGYGYVNGRKYEVLAAGNVSVLVAIDVVGKYVRADIYVINESPYAVDVLPSNVVLTELEPKQKPLRFVDTDKLIRSAERQIAMGNALTVMGASMQRQTSTTTTTGTVSAIGSNGASGMGTYREHSTTSSPDYAAQTRANETIRARNEAFASTAASAFQTILRANTLQPNERIEGRMLFERDKKEKSIMLSGIVGDTIYQFPFDLTVQ